MAADPPAVDLGDIARWGRPAIPDEAVAAYGHAYDAASIKGLADRSADLNQVEADAIRAGLAAAWPHLAKADRPHVRVEPGMAFGRPQICGVTVEAITGMLVAGETPAVVCDEYGITRSQLLVACWHGARYGPRRRKAWKTWLNRWEETLWRGELDQVPLPTEEANDA